MPVEAAASAMVLVDTKVRLFMLSSLSSLGRNGWLRVCPKCLALTPVLGTSVAR